MSKLDVTFFDDNHMKPEMLTALVEAFYAQTSKFPEALLITKEQAEKFFYQAGQLLNNFKGVPIEIEKDVTELQTKLKTINSVLVGMHKNSVRDVAEVYRLLEKLKEKLQGNV